MHYIISRIPHMEGLDEKSDYEMWSGSGDFMLVTLRASSCGFSFIQLIDVFLHSICL